MLAKSSLQILAAAIISLHVQPTQGLAQPAMPVMVEHPSFDTDVDGIQELADSWDSMAPQACRNFAPEIGLDVEQCLALGQEDSRQFRANFDHLDNHSAKVRGVFAQVVLFIQLSEECTGLAPSIEFAEEFVILPPSILLLWQLEHAARCTEQRWEALRNSLGGSDMKAFEVLQDAIDEDALGGRNYFDVWDELLTRSHDRNKSSIDH